MFDEGGMRVLLSTLVAICAFSDVGAAEEQLRPLAQSGDWIALAHQENITAPPDVCLVMTPIPHGVIAFRNNGEVTEFRVSNDQWSLPVEVNGTVKLAVGVLAKEYQIGGNTDHTVSIVLPEDDLPPIFSAMDKAASMTVATGKAKATSVSLIGSTKATNAFRTCAHIKTGPAQSGSEANPF